MGIVDSVLSNPAWALPIYDLGPYIACAAALSALVCLIVCRRIQPGRYRLVPWLASALLMIIASSVLAARSTVIERIGSGRFAVLHAMRERPHDPWPRGIGHVPLGPFGSSEAQKGYLEPGGSFSPAANTFGISFWIVERSGALIATSDDIPLSQTHAHYISSPTGEPGIVVETPYYRATWTVRSDRGFNLAVASHTSPDRHVEISFRGVGPAAGPLQKVRLQGDVLNLNDSWSIGPVEPDWMTFIGHEGAAGWTLQAPSKALVITSESGWAHARFAVPPVDTLNLVLVGSSPVESVPIPLQSEPQFRGLDPKFITALKSQITTLQLGLVGRETRPGDPLNYPLQWLRDGAFVVVALARAGQTLLAEQLAVAFTKSDFFGGFGAEADAPGLALWALAETSALINSHEYDKAIWPHVSRKVELILQMLRATSEIRHDYSGAVVPQYKMSRDLTLVAGPSREGLIDGRMDWHSPVFFVNAVSYAGLVGAAEIAGQLGAVSEAAAWGRVAADLRQAWLTAFRSSDWSAQVENERTAISGLWPSDIAPKAGFTELLERRASGDAGRRVARPLWTYFTVAKARQLLERFWQRIWGDSRRPVVRPLWTYFTIAEAHQWLRLGRVDRVWSTLDLLWSQQPAPGLYTLWEGQGEENNFGLWKQLRGWAMPPNVTPHYWAAAEMLLLQLAMLAETQGGPESEELVIGSGVPAEWLSHEIAVSGVGTSHGFIDWTWDGAGVAVTIHGNSLPVRLGPAFPTSARLSVRVITAGQP